MKSKRIILMLVVLVLGMVNTVLICQDSNDEDLPRIYIRVPSRFVRLIDTDTSQVYLDQKSKSVLTILRKKDKGAGQSSSKSESLFQEKLADDNCYEVSKEWLQLKTSDCHIVTWLTKKRSKNRKNNQNHTAFLDIAGVQYIIHMGSPSINEKDIIPMYNKILKSIKLPSQKKKSKQSNQKTAKRRK